MAQKHEGPLELALEAYAGPRQWSQPVTAHLSVTCTLSYERSDTWVEKKLEWRNRTRDLKFPVTPTYQELRHYCVRILGPVLQSAARNNEHGQVASLCLADLYKLGSPAR
jgi:hypothetical protein